MAKRKSSVASFSTSTIVIVALAMLIFVIAVAIGVSLLGGSEPSEPASEPVSVVEESKEPEESKKPAESKNPEESKKPEEEPKEDEKPSGPEEVTPSSSTAPVSSEVPASSAAPASSAVPAVSTASVAVTSTVPSTFDASVMGSSGKENIAAYKQINSDVKGWLKIPGTNINYPVFQSAPGYDAHYYLDRNIYRQASRNGVLYAGSTAKFGTGKSGLSLNTVIFGHNWTNYSANPRIGNANDVMFAQLTAYHHLNFAKAYPYLWFSTETTEMPWVIFAAFYTDVGFFYIDPNPSAANHAAVIAGAKARSRHIYDVDVDSSDRIITLSTCTRAYGSSENQRFVVMARQLREGESFTPITVTANPNPVLPKL